MSDEKKKTEVEVDEKTEEDKTELKDLKAKKDPKGGHNSRSSHAEVGTR